MITHKYGEFTDFQLDDYKKKLHKKIHWLLLYKDPNVESIEDANFQQYYFWLMKHIAGANSLLNYPKEMIELLAVLQQARRESYKDDFDFGVFRKLILDAHALVDRIGGDQSDNT